jgi:hypothetical protein
MLVKPDDSALAHIGDNPNKISVLSGGTAALLRRLAREPDVPGHQIRLFYSSDYTGSYVQWPSLAAATHGIAAERPQPPLPTVSMWGHR